MSASTVTYTWPKNPKGDCVAAGGHDWPSKLGLSAFTAQAVGTKETCERCGGTRTVMPS